MTEVETLARTAFGEASSDGEAGMTAVCNVVVNRVNSGVTWWGSSIAGVCLAKMQFDCWFPGTADYNRMLAATTDDPAFATALAIAEQAVAGILADTTRGATTYKRSDLPWPRSWGDEIAPLVVIGSQSFYNLG